MERRPYDAAEAAGREQGLLMELLALAGGFLAASVRVQQRANGTVRAVVTDVRGHFEIVALATGGIILVARVEGGVRR